MPRCVRNFWLDLNVDGKKSRVGTGPRRSDGGFDLNILMRENKDISEKKVLIRGIANNNGELELRLYVDGVNQKDLLLSLIGQGDDCISIKTQR